MNLPFIQKKQDVKEAFLGVIHSKPGIGKTTFASQCKTGIYFDLEDSADYLTINNYVKPTSYSELLSQLDDVGRALVKGEISTTDINMIFIDTLTGLLSMMIPDVLELANASENTKHTDIVQFKYGVEKYQRLLIGKLLSRLKRFRDLGVSTFILAHSIIEKAKDPIAADAYDFYNIQCQKMVLADIVQESSLIFYADSPIVTYGSKGNKKARADGDMNILRVGTSPAFLSKNRISIADEIDLCYDTFSEAFKDAINNLKNK